MALLNFVLLLSFIFANNNAFTTGSQDLVIGDFFDNIINTAIETLLNGFIRDIADPLIMTSYEKSFTDNTIPLSGNVKLSNLNITGVKTAAAKNISVERAKNIFNMSVIIQQISLYSDYDVDLTFLKWIPLFGKGNIKATLTGLDLDLRLTAAIQLEKPYVKNLGVKEIKLLLGDETAVKIEGLMNDEEYTGLVNELIEEYIHYVEDQPELAGKEIAQVLQAILDYIQKKKNIDIFEALDIDE